MRKIVSILRIALVLACLVLAVPTVVSAADPARAPEYDGTSKAFYGNGTSFDVYPGEGDTEWLVVWGWNENFQPSEFEVIPADTPIYAGSKTGDVVPDQSGDPMMSITLQGVTVEKLYLHGKTGKVVGEVDLFLEDGAEITEELKVDGNLGVMITFYAKTKIAEGAKVSGAENRGDEMRIVFVRGSGMTKADLDKFFPGIEIVEILAADIIVGENGSLQGGMTWVSTEAFIGSALLDPKYDDESEWVPIPNPGYKFDGWYLNGTRIDLFKTPMTEAYFENAPINEDGMATVTVYAKWIPVSHKTGMDNMGGMMMALIILTGAAAGITSGVLMMRRRSSAK